MKIAHYRFARNNKSIEGAVSNNQLNTDALNAVNTWAKAKPQRSFDILEDEDEKLLLKLSWSESDGSAGPDLEQHCIKKGVERIYEQP